MALIPPLPPLRYLLQRILNLVCVPFFLIFTEVASSLWSVRGTLWGGYTACDTVSTMHELGGASTRGARGLFSDSIGQGA